MTAPTADADNSYRRLVLLVTTLGAFMTPLDGSIVTVALPTISAALKMSYLEVIWVPTAYLLCVATLLLTFGRLSDVKGRKPIFTTGFGLFTAASALCSLAQNGIQLAVSRVAQGVGAAMVGATSAAIVTEAFPGSGRGRALGVNTAAVYTGLSLGPTLGGLLVEAFGWRSIFYVNVPIGMLVTSLAATRLRRRRAEVRDGKRFDLPGAASFSGGLALILLALMMGGGNPWTQTFVLVLAGGLALLAIFLTLELKRGTDALLDLSLFSQNKLFAAANLSALLNYTSFAGVTFFISFYLQRVRGLPPGQTGLVLVSMPVTMALLAPTCGWLSDRFGSRTFASAGMTLISAALLLLSQLGSDSPLTQVLAGLFMLGVGMGFFSTPNTSAVMGSVDRDRLGVASGTLATMRSMGQSLSLALMGVVAATIVPAEVLAALFGGSAGTGQVPTETFLQGLARAFSVAAGIALIGALTSLARGREEHNA